MNPAKNTANPDPHTLEQWRMLAAVIDHGGFAAGAEALGKSQSALSYGVQRLQEAIGIPLLRLRGRKAVLTADGEILLRRARHLLEEADRLQRLASTLARGNEPVIRLAADLVFPTEWILQALSAFSAQHPDTRIELHETVLSGASEMLLNREADLAITGRVPPGFFGEKLHTFEFITVAHPQHALHRLGRPLTAQDLAQYRQIVIRDSGLRHKVDSGWLGAEQRWTVSHISTSVAALIGGLGFASLPRERIGRELAQGLLAELDIEGGGRREIPLYRVLADPDEAGPAVRELAGLLAAACQAMP